MSVPFAMESSSLDQLSIFIKFLFKLNFSLKLSSTKTILAQKIKKIEG